MNTAKIAVVVQSVTAEAAGILSFDLRPADGGTLPPFEAGAHIDLHLANGLVRSYSLVNPPWERHRYVVAVALDRNSSGGSRFLFDRQLAGQIITISAPRNNFRLVENAANTALIAGGIGVAPLFCMAQRLEALGRPWQLHYATRDRASCAFRSPLEALEAARPGRVHFNFDQEHGRIIDLPAIVAAVPLDAHIYCCGPIPMLEAFKAAAAARPAERVHVEYFAAPVTTGPALGNAYTVTLARSGRTLEVPAGQTILSVLSQAGIFAASSCETGICGACEVTVLQGIPDHRDHILTDAERVSNTRMMICVSGCQSDNLVLDL